MPDDVFFEPIKTEPIKTEPASPLWARWLLVLWIVANGVAGYAAAVHLDPDGLPHVVVGIIAAIVGPIGEVAIFSCLSWFFCWLTDPTVTFPDGDV